MQYVSSPAIDHIRIDIAQVIKVADELSERIGVDDKVPCSGVLNEVTIRPRFVSRHDFCHLRHVLAQVEVERCPVPSSIEVDGLPLVAVGGEHNGIAVTASIDSAVGEEDVAVRG